MNRCIPPNLLTEEVMKVDAINYTRECFELAMDATKYFADIHTQPLRHATPCRGEEKVVVIEEGELPDSESNYTTVKPCTMTIYSKKRFIQPDTGGSDSPSAAPSARHDDENSCHENREGKMDASSGSAGRSAVGSSAGRVAGIGSGTITSSEIDDGKKCGTGSGHKAGSDDSGNMTLPCETERLSVMLVETSLNVVAIGNFLFLFGMDSDTYTGVLRRFDGATRKWLPLVGAPRRPTVAYTSARAGDDILQVGGMLVTRDSERVRDADKFVHASLRYSIRQNRWTKAARFPARVAYAASCTTKDHVLYVAGGNVPRLGTTTRGTLPFCSSRKLHMYDHREDVWMEKADMCQGRSEVVFQALEDALFVIGGCRYEDNEPVPSIEMYNVLCDQWSVVEETPGFPYDSAASFTHHDAAPRIIILGGYVYKTDTSLSSVSVFSPDETLSTLVTQGSDRTSHVTTLSVRLTGPICQHACAVLKMN